jgi:HAD superfamily hydrolase (TIGR01450 family)
VRRQLSLRGMEPVAEADHATADALVVGIDLDLNYDKLAAAQAVALRGVPFVGTDLDGAYPWEDRWLPGSGSFVAAVERASGRRAIGAGKPEPTMYQALLHQVPDDALPVVVGDNPATDIRAGRAAGFPTVLVLTGIASEGGVATLTPDEQPDYVVADLAAFVHDVVPRLVEMREPLGR